MKPRHAALRERADESVVDGAAGFVTNGGVRSKNQAVLVSEDRLSVNLKRHSVILPVQSSHAVF